MKLKPLLITPNCSIKKAISVIDKGSAQVALIIDSSRKLLGIATDGDIRRGIINNLSLDCNVTSIMTKKPITLNVGFSHNQALELMSNNTIQHIPIVDSVGEVVDLVVLDQLLKKTTFETPIVIMAGGKGERLGSLTKDCPKPMLEINGKPMLEVILQRCIQSGFRNFFFSVNYLKEKIINYFGTGDKWGVNISYLEEREPLGTCGSLRLLPSDIAEDIIVMNGDVLTDLEVDRLFNYHNKSNALMTICTRLHRVRIPFAVLGAVNSKLDNFVEKPIYDFQVNAGVYVLNTSLIKRVPKTYFDMTDLIEDLLDSNQEIGVFPIHENWKDIGNPIDFKEAVDSFIS